MDDFEAFVAIFSKLVGDSGDPPQSRHPIVSAIVNGLSKLTIKNFAQEQMLEAFRRDRRLLMRERGNFVYLKVPRRRPTIVPVTLLDVDFNCDPPILRMEVVLFMDGEDGALNSIGMRFETPEDPDGGGMHDFHHAQLVKSVAKMIPLPNCPIWLPDKQPSFPLDARDPVQLLICAITSVYGAKEIGSLRRGCNEIWNRAQEMRLAPGLIKKS